MPTHGHGTDLLAADPHFPLPTLSSPVTACSWPQAAALAASIQEHKGQLVLQLLQPRTVRGASLPVWLYVLMSRGRESVAAGMAWI